MASSLLSRIESAHRSLLTASPLPAEGSSTPENNPFRPDAVDLEMHTQLLSSKLSSIHRELSRRRPLITNELESEVGQLFESLTTGLESAASGLENFVTTQSQDTDSTWTRENIRNLEDSICFHGQTVSLLVEYMRL
jgi:hypothetical protein